MEALELYKEENRKMEEHKYACQAAEKEVETWDHPTFYKHCCFLILEEWGVELKNKTNPQTSRLNNAGQMLSEVDLSSSQNYTDKTSQLNKIYTYSNIWIFNFKLISTTAD